MRVQLRLRREGRSSGWSGASPAAPERKSQIEVRASARLARTSARAWSSCSTTGSIVDFGAASREPASRRATSSSCTETPTKPWASVS